MDEQALKRDIRSRYGALARGAEAGAGCCGPAASCSPITSGLYGAEEASAVPEQALLASLGCGNPTALADLHPGETVLDLGSGGGIDALLSARRVGPAGKVYGLDMTDEMLALARENVRRAGVTNVEFLKGDIERIPLPGGSVDVIISNCVINLAADKRRVLAEAFRVLRPGGRFAVSDIVVLGAMPDEARRQAELWAGCVAGALEAGEFRRLLDEVGFADAEVEPVRVYRTEEVRGILDGLGADARTLVDEMDGKLASAFIRGRKPVVEECLEIRQARPADRERVFALLDEAGLPRTGVPDDLAHFAVAELDSGLVIAASGLEVYGNSGLLRSTVVDPSWRGSGVGRLVVDAVLEDARRAGIEDLYLLTTTAINYFPKFGFRCVERDDVPEPVCGSPEFRGACPETATVMHRKVGRKEGR
jgi:arsenite methyltransferase